MNRWRAWAQLFRVPNTFTSCADVLAGMCIVGGVSHSIVAHPASAIVGSLASIAMYWAGMALNDVFDVEEDTRNNRPGPLVTGAIPRAQAGRAVWVLFILGVVLASIAATLMSDSVDTWKHAMPARIVAVLLVLAICMYDGPLKSTPLAPAVMGLCRALNMGLGMAIVTGGLQLPMPNHAWMILVGHGLYVTGITIAARKESDLSQSKRRLIAGWSVSALGLACIALCGWVFPEPKVHLESPWAFLGLVVVLMLPWARHALASITTLEPSMLGMAIVQAIVSILFLDAALGLQYGGRGAGVWICALVLPTWWLGRRFRST